MSGLKGCNFVFPLMEMKTIELAHLNFMIKLNLKPTTKNKEFESFLMQSQDMGLLFTKVLS